MIIIISLGFVSGIIAFVIVRVLIGCLYTVRPDQRAVVTSFGAVQKLQEKAAPPPLSDDEMERYHYPQVRVVGPGGPYFKMPWQRVHKVSVATQAVDLSWDPTKAQTTIEAVTKDNLTTGVNGQIRYRISENNLYPYLFGVASPLEHVMGYFVSVLRERIANFVDPKGQSLLADAAIDEGAEAGSANQCRRAFRRRFDQRLAKELAAPEPVHGRAMPLNHGTIWNRTRRRADYRDRPAT